MDVAGFRAEVDAVDVVVVQGFVVRTFPWLQDVPQHIVVDLYDPFQLETLEVPAPDEHPVHADVVHPVDELVAQVVHDLTGEHAGAEPA